LHCASDETLNAKMNNASKGKVLNILMAYLFYK
jgi:hypothetical protein